MHNVEGQPTVVLVRCAQRRYANTEPLAPEQKEPDPIGPDQATLKS